MATYVGNGGMTIAGVDEKSRTLSKGMRVDLDEVVLPAAKDRPAQTLGQAVAADVHLFQIDEDVTRETRARTRKELPSDSDPV